MVALKSARVVRGVDNGPKTLDLGTTLETGSPLAVASQSTRWGGDGGWARVVGVSASTVDVVIDEDVTCNSERKHTQEEVSVVAFSQACVIF